jgi:hypothetical protein
VQGGVLAETGLVTENQRPVCDLGFFLGNSEFLVGGQKTKSENEAGQRRPGIVVFWIQGLSSGGFTQKLG